MCPPEISRCSRPPTLNTDYTWFSRCYCIYAFGYQRAFNTPIICCECYVNMGSPDNYNTSEFHALMYGEIYNFKCRLCLKGLRLMRKAVECDECFTIFMNIVGALRRDNYDIHSIVRLHYDLIDDVIVTLYLNNPDGIDEDRILTL